MLAVWAVSIFHSKAWGRQFTPITNYSLDLDLHELDSAPEILKMGVEANRVRDYH